MIKILLSGLKGKGLFALIDDEDLEKVSKYSWTLHVDGYAKTSVRIDGKPRQLYLHKLVLPVPEGLEVDHVDTAAKLDCRKQNLRPATRSQQNYNQGITKRNTSGYKGVSFKKSTGQWRATIGWEGGFFFIAYADTKEEAAYIYDQVAMQLHGEFAKTNFEYDN